MRRLRKWYESRYILPHSRLISLVIDDRVPSMLQHWNFDHTYPAIAVPTLMNQIAIQYGISNMTNFNTPTIQALPLGSIDQKFDDYTKAVSLKGTDIVKFWHVSNIFAIFMI